MAALFLAPFYLAVCFYVLNWMLKWMASAIIFLLWLLSAMDFLPVHSDSYHFAVFFSDQKAGWTASDFKNTSAIYGWAHFSMPDRYRQLQISFRILL